MVELDRNAIEKDAYNTILHLIRTRGEISKKEISEETSLRFPSVSRYVNNLLKLRLIQETGLRKSEKAGKPALNLSIDGRGAYSVAIDAQHTKGIQGGILDFRGRPAGRIYKRKYVYSTDDIVSVSTSLIRKILNDHADLKKNLTGIGIALLGVVDLSGETVYKKSGTEIKKIELKKEIEDIFQIPCVMENRINASLYGLKYFTFNDKLKNAVAINHMVNDTATRCSILIDGKIYKGTSNTAGEFYSGDMLFFPTLSETKDDMSFLEKRTVNLAIKIAFLINFLSPEAIIVLGDYVRVKKKYEDLLFSTIKKHTILDVFYKTKILFDRHSNLSSLYGAGAMVFDKLLPETIRGNCNVKIKATSKNKFG